ncbi:MAG TPA: YIP1 family protein [Gemmatimonas sp.]|uniref:YIP1 family protein n=1 Tax=Gemmatimonas sp. TaxID=1962908 RepID=UPI002ED8D5C2
MSDYSTETVKQSGVIEDLLEVLWAPAAVFNRTRERKAGMYLLVLALVGLVIVVSTGSLARPYLEANADLQMALAAKAGKPIPEAAVNMTRNITVYAYYASPLLFIPIGALLSALFIKWAGKTMSAPLRYGQALTIAAITSSPRLFGFIATAVQGAILDTSNVKSMGDSSLGPARFVDPLTMSSPLYTFLVTIDVFSVWQYVLIAIAVSVVARVERTTGAIVALITWALGSALTLIPGLLAS